MNLSTTLNTDVYSTSIPRFQTFCLLSFNLSHSFKFSVSFINVISSFHHIMLYKPGIVIWLCLIIYLMIPNDCDQDGFNSNRSSTRFGSGSKRGGGGARRDGERRRGVIQQLGQVRFLNF